MAAPYSGEWVVSSLLDDRAEKLTDNRFVSSRSGELTYGELRDEAQRFAHSLQDLGVAPGDRVATMLDSSIEYVTCWFGIVWAGAIDVPVNTEYKGTFLEHVLRDSGANVLVIDGRWMDRLEGLSIPDLTHIVVVGDPAAESPVAIHRLPELLTADPAPLVRRTEMDLVYIMYTSGTTGPSKGVMHTNRSSLWYIQPFLRQLGWRDGDVVYANFPLFHQMGRATMTTAAMWQGERVVLRPVFSVSDFWKDVREIGATIFGFLGSIILMLDALPEQPDDADNPLRVGFGAAAPPELMEKFERRFGVTLLENYGSTECGVPAHAMPGDIKVGTMGRPTWYMDVEIHDEQDKPVPTGTKGEIVVRPREPDSIFAGYWNDPAATVEAFRNLWFHSGDAGFIDDEGYLTYVDRIKDSIRRRGENISSFEVERAVQAHPDVLECAAYAVPSEFTEDEVMIAVVAAGEELDVNALFRFCIDTIPRFAVPRYIRVVDALPKTPSQRVQKYKLRAAAVTADAVDREALGLSLRRAE